MLRPQPPHPIGHAGCGERGRPAAGGDWVHCAAHHLERAGGVGDGRWELGASICESACCALANGKGLPLPCTPCCCRAQRPLKCGKPCKGGASTACHQALRSPCRRRRRAGHHLPREQRLRGLGHGRLWALLGLPGARVRAVQGALVGGPAVEKAPPAPAAEASVHYGWEVFCRLRGAEGLAGAAGVPPPQEGFWKWLSGVTDNSVYPVMFLSYLTQVCAAQALLCTVHPHFFMGLCRQWHTRSGGTRVAGLGSVGC